MEAQDLHTKLAGAVERGVACWRQPEAARPPMSPLEVVLGKQPARERHAAALRKTDSFRRKLFGQEAGSEEPGLGLEAAEPGQRDVRVHPHSAFRRY